MEERDSMPISDEKFLQNLVSSLNGRDSFEDQECTWQNRIDYTYLKKER